MDTSGIHVKNKLGLGGLPFVKIARLIGYSISIYLIFYDTRRPQLPLTTRRILKAPMPTMAYRYPFKRRPPMTPPRDIDDWNGEHKNALFFSIDLAGYMGDEKELTRIIDSSMKVTGRLQEFVTFDDLQNDSSATDFTRNTRRQRNQAVGAESRVAELIDVELNPSDDYVTFQFMTEVTEPIYPDDYTFQQTNPTNKNLQRNTGKTYEIELRILEFFSWLDTRPDDAGDLTSSDIKDVLDTANVQVWSNAPSYHYQGMNFYASQLDASIYPTDIEPQFWNQSHLHGSGPYLLDKHLLGLVKAIKFWRQPMASMLTKRLKSRGFL